MMKKYIVFTLLILAFTAVTLTVSAEEISIDKEVLEKLLQGQENLEKVLKRQESLEDRIRELEKQVQEKTSAVPAETSAQKEIENVKDEVEELSERLDKTELKTILDKIEIGGEFRTRLDSFHFRNVAYGDQEKKIDMDEFWWNRLRLNLRSEITDNIIFQGRLEYIKSWGDSSIGEIGDMGYGEHQHNINAFGFYNTGSNARVERAYIDYFVPDTPFSLTFGRLPTANGPPVELRNNSTRKATWPTMAVNENFDGVLANLSLDAWTRLKNCFLRFGYLIIEQFHDADDAAKRNSMRIGVVNLETEVPGIRNSLFYIGYTRMNSMLSLHVGPSYPEDAADVDEYNIYLQLNNIGNTGLDWFGAFSYNHIDVRTRGTVLNADPLYEVGLFCDSMHGDMGENRDGYAFYTGLRYKLPFEKLKNPSIGLEYNYGSKFWAPLSKTQNREDIANKIALRGKALEFYYLQPIYEGRMFCRAGAVYFDYDYYIPYVYYGSPLESDMTMFSTYFMVDVRF